MDRDAGKQDQLLRAILGGVPDAQDGRRLGVGDAIDKNIRPNRDQLAGAG